MARKQSKMIINFKDRSFFNVASLFFFLVIDVILPCTFIFVFYLSDVVNGSLLSSADIPLYYADVIKWAFTFLVLSYVILEAHYFPISNKEVAKLVLVRVSIVALIILFATDSDNSFIHYVLFEIAVAMFTLMVMFVYFLVLCFRRTGETLRAFLFVLTIPIGYLFLMTTFRVPGEVLEMYMQEMSNDYAVLIHYSLWIFFLVSTVYLKWKLLRRLIRNS